MNDFDRYVAPPTEETSVVGLSAPGHDEGEAVAPIPALAPPHPRRHPRWGSPSAMWFYLDARGATLQIVCRFDLSGSRKHFAPLTLWRGSQGLEWRWKGLPAPRPLYGLDKLAARPDVPVVICEGEKGADAAGVLFADHVALTSPNGSGAPNKADWTPLARRRVIIWPDHDAAGRKYAQEVGDILVKLQCEVSIIDVAAFVAIDPGNRGPNWSPDGWDAANAIQEWADHVALGRAALGCAKPYVTASIAARGTDSASDSVAIERRIQELCALRDVDYERVRSAAARELGIRASAVDRLVKEHRSLENADPGRAITFVAVQPWPEPVEGAALLVELAATVRRYVVLTNPQADAVCLWIAFTHVHDAFDVSPRLIVKSPQKRSGKTRLFSVLARLVARPRGASGITSSALRRLIELRHPTMLIDEVDTLMRGDREMSQALRGLINSGFNRDFATFTMNVPTRDNGYEPHEFSTWAPLALAGIGNLPETIRDRSIEIEMKRKLKSEKVERLRRRDGGDLDQIARKLARWSQENIDSLRAAHAEMPEALNDRAADAWEPLIAIADLVSGDWPALARAAALALSGESVDDENIGSTLLADIQGIFRKEGADRLSSEDLTNYLVALDERPWAECKGGRPMTKFQLSRLLKDYGIVSKTVRLDGGRTPKGYHLADFADAFQRYLSSDPAAQLATSPQAAEIKTFEVKPVSPQPSPCFELRNDSFASKSATCGDVASSEAIGSASMREGGGDQSCPTL
jgi:Protein of unknown function (DUF3631)